MKIVILSNNRADDVKTFNKMPLHIQQLTSIIVYPNQLQEYKLHNSTANFITSPPGVNGIAARREWICKHIGSGIVWMLDDDIRISKSFHNEDKPTVSHRVIQDDEWNELLSDIQLTIDCGYDVGGLFTRSAPLKRQYYPGIAMQRVYTNTWLNLDKIDTKAINWTDVQFAEDFHVQAQLAKLGHQQITLSTFSSCPTETQSAGGCSDTRTVDNHNVSMRKLNELYGENCKLTKSKVLMDGQVKLKCRLKLPNLSPLSKDEQRMKYDEFRSVFDAADFNQELREFYKFYNKDGTRIK